MLKSMLIRSHENIECIRLFDDWFAKLFHAAGVLTLSMLPKAPNFEEYLAKSLQTIDPIEEKKKLFKMWVLCHIWWSRSCCL